MVPERVTLLHLGRSGNPPALSRRSLRLPPAAPLVVVHLSAHTIIGVAGPVEANSAKHSEFFALSCELVQLLVEFGVRRSTLRYIAQQLCLFAQHSCALHNTTTIPAHSSSNR